MKVRGYEVTKVRGGRASGNERPAFAHCCASSALPFPTFLPSYLLALLTVLAACDSAVEPYAEDGLFPFAFFGYLDTAADTQYVRAVPVRRGGEGAFDLSEIEVALVRTSTGERTSWQGRAVRLDDGTSGQVFFAAMPVAPDEVYGLEAKGADGLEVRAHTRVPGRLPVRIGEVAQGPQLRQEVVFPDVQPRPLELAMRYRVAAGPGEPPQEVVIPYERGLTPTGDSLRLTVRLSADRAAILERLGRPADDVSVVLLGLGLAYGRLSDEWPPPELPLTLGDGVGFFGSVGRFVEPWTLPDSTVAALGFAPPP